MTTESLIAYYVASGQYLIAQRILEQSWEDQSEAEGGC